MGSLHFIPYTPFTRKKNYKSSLKLRLTTHTQPIIEDYLPVISNASRLKSGQEFLKELAVSHDQNGIFREFYTEISDQR